jgi:hypothetical protein
MVFYFEITENIQFLTRKVLIFFCTSFPFYFLYVFLVNENLVSKYEQLLILTDIDGSTLEKNGQEQGSRNSTTVTSFFIVIYSYHKKIVIFWIYNIFNMIQSRTYKDVRFLIPSKI